MQIKMMSFKLSSTDTVDHLWPNMETQPGMVAHNFDSSTQEAEAGGSLRVQDHPGLQIDSKTLRIEKPCIKKQNKKKQHSHYGHSYLRLGIQVCITKQDLNHSNFQMW